MRQGHIVPTCAWKSDLRSGSRADYAFGRMPDTDMRIQASEQRRAACSRSLLETAILGEARKYPRGVNVLAVDGRTPAVCGGYRLEKILAKGAMGRVYLGRNSTSDQVAAIKTMALPRECEAGDTLNIKNRLCDEAQTTRRLKHPAIVNIFDIGDAHGLVYMAMEFLPGGDLSPFVAPAKLLPLTRVLSIVAQVADALSYVHARGIVHCDVKPANIMLGQEGNAVKLSDFGIAHAVGDRPAPVVGTPAYWSPEQLCGRELDGRSDLFSLGVTLYQLSSGSLPFHGDTLAQLMCSIAGKAHTNVLTVNPALPPALAKIIDRALSKQPRNRYRNGADMARALRSCMHGMVSQGGPRPALDARWER